MRNEAGEAIKNIQRKLDATDLVILAKRDWDKISDDAVDGVVYFVLRSVD